MIRDVDESLCAWLGEMVAEMVSGTDDAVSVTVGLPSAEEGRTSGPALFLYLASVRQDSEGSLAAWDAVRADDELTVGRTPPLRRYRLAYLVVPQAPDAATEHELLGRVLAGGALSDVVPEEHLRGSLADAVRDVLVVCAPAEAQADTGALWLAWGLAPRAAVELSVLAPLPMGYVAAVAAPPSEILVGAARREPVTAGAASRGEGASRAPLRPPPRGRISEDSG